MLASDLVVLVRDKSLARRGVITAKYLDLKATLRHNGVGDWTLKLPRVHPMSAVLATSGSGLLVYIKSNGFGPAAWDVLFSGPTRKPEEVTNSQNPDGTYTFTGKTDDILLAGGLAFPSPGVADPGAQTQANDIRTGDAESLMRTYVNVNVGPAAPAGRRTGLRDKIVLETNLNRGITLSKSPRFQNLGALLGEIGLASGLGFRCVQVDSDIHFQVFEPEDRSALVRLDVRSGTLTSTTLQKSAPNLTRAIVAGQGEGTDRTILQITTPESEAAEDEWGVPIELFVDQRNTDETDELTQKGLDKLTKDGFTATAVKAVPADDQTMRFKIDWNLGDWVGVVAYGQPTKAQVTEVAVLVNSQRVAIGAAIGDLANFDPAKALTTRVEDTEQRVSNLERSIEQSATIDWSAIVNVPDATDAQKGIVELATPAETVTGTADDLASTPEGVKAALDDRVADDAGTIAGVSTDDFVTPHGLGAWGRMLAPLVAQLNPIINGRFRTNQRGYVSRATLASGAYGPDRWKATTANTTLTFSANANFGQPVTINSGGSIAQVIERANLPAGDYLLAWDGTATARVYNAGAGSPPAYAASPVVVSIDGTANVVVEFAASGGTKTLDKVRVYPGSVDLGYVPDPIDVELRRCQRYCNRGTLRALGYGSNTPSLDAGPSAYYTFAGSMRTTPTITMVTTSLFGSPAGYASGWGHISKYGCQYQYTHGGPTGSGLLGFLVEFIASAEL